MFYPSLERSNSTQSLPGAGNSLPLTMPPPRNVLYLQALLNNNPAPMLLPQ